MKLILTADVDHLGAPGDIVEVKPGYGRNYLLPRGLAILATRGAEKQIEGIRRAQEARAIQGLDHAKEVKAALEALEGATIAVRTHDSGKLFGSVTAGDVATAVAKANGPKLDKRVIEMPKTHIKSTGKHQVTVVLHPEVSATVTVEVVSE